LGIFLSTLLFGLFAVVKILKGTLVCSDRLDYNFWLLCTVDSFSYLACSSLTSMHRIACSVLWHQARSTTNQLVD